MIDFEITVNDKSDIEGEINNVFNNSLRYFDVSEDKLKGLADLILDYERENVLQGRDIFGNRLSNKAGTRPLYRTGNLSRSFAEKKIPKGFSVFVKGEPNEYGSALNYRKKNPLKFFGIGQSLDNDIDAYLGNLFAIK